MAGEVAGEVPSFPAWRQPSVSQVKIAALGQIHGMKFYFMIHQSLDENVSSMCGTRSLGEQTSSSRSLIYDLGYQAKSKVTTGWFSGSQR